MQAQMSEIKVSYIFIAPINDLARGESTKCDVLMEPYDATNNVLSWSSSDESVATVSQNGTVTAIGAGTATISASTTDGSNLTTNIDITVAVAESEGVNYKITSNVEPYTVGVCKGNYDGDIVIPETVEINGITYSVTSIENRAFEFSEITSISIANTVTDLGKGTFYGCYFLTSVTLSNTITSIGAEMFSGCSKLSIIEIPETVTNIGESAFKNCDRLKSIVIPEGVTEISSYLFDRCSSLKNITLPSTIESIGYNAFNYSGNWTWDEYGNRIMKEISRTIKCNAITPPKLGSFVFDCNIITLEVPFESVLAYKEDASWSEYDITYVSKKVDGQNFLPTSDTEIEVTKDEENNNYTGEVVIPGELTIDDKTYTVSSIGESAFAGCTEMTSVSIPESISSIESTAFEGCTGLQLLDMSECTSLETISANTFNTCTSLEAVNFPSSLITIGDNAFASCNSLLQMSIPCVTPPAIEGDGNPFEGIDVISCALSIPTESVNAYKASDFWSVFVDGENKKDIQISVVNNEEDDETQEAAGCDIRYKKYTENAPVPLSLNSVKASLADEEAEAYSNEIGKAVTGNGQSVFVGNGDALTFYFTPEDGTELDKVIYNGDDVTEQLAGNTFTTPAVKEVSSLNVLLKKGTLTGVEDTFIETAGVVEESRYDISGRVLNAPVQGLNIVKMSDGTMKKVFVK